MRAGCLLLSLLALVPDSASADFHLVSIREVYAGRPADPDAQYVLLQMYQAGQNSVAGHSLTVYDASGIAVGGPYTFTSNVSNGANQAYIWIATPAAEALFELDADLLMTATLVPSGGKVCFENVDCFAWGNYSGDSSAPSPSGNAFQPASGLSPGMTATRDISAGSATLLEEADDTDDSAADFIEANPAPGNNDGSGGGPSPYPGEGDGDGSGGGYGGGGGSLGFLASALFLGLAAVRRITGGARAARLPRRNG